MPESGGMFMRIIIACKCVGDLSFGNGTNGDACLSQTADENIRLPLLLPERVALLMRLLYPDFIPLNRGFFWLTLLFLRAVLIRVCGKVYADFFGFVKPLFVTGLIFS
ncbi:MAG: hypothetical protein CVU35_09945 [Betaproteobacteria bacterium HGW-Betaproteobacteria-8]|nr:MAG: hypothetical protein CVU35_09945 [Betaproteobacteria bacterium HGW-Betaproteobacteria-8]